VSQEPVLFSDTIKANIAFGVGDIDMEAIEQAARDARIHNDISGFSSGYDTIIGERGITLSGGQRQRLALARALACDRPVLVIDDGLSAVDTTTENEITEVLRQRLAGKTVFIVSNRIKLLSMTDKILIFEEGRLVNTGTHETLVGENDFYHSMYVKQKQNGERDG
jgi:ATP-binding cassette subfamily B multidrug efflux pump